MTEKNYYQILGIDPNAEDFVIRAAYKVLAQRYHPDKYNGTKDVALEKMHKINEAYATLSDPVKRKIYDEKFINEKDATSENQSNCSQDDVLNSDWAYLVKHYPDLNQITGTLSKFSQELCEQYKLDLMSSKKFNEREQIANDIGQDFLKERFGTDKKVLKFAFELISTGHHEAAKELNQAVLVLGKSFDFSKVYPDIEKKYRPEVYSKFEKEQAEHFRAKQEAEKRRKAYKSRKATLQNN